VKVYNISLDQKRDAAYFRTRYIEKERNKQTKKETKWNKQTNQGRKKERKRNKRTENKKNERIKV